VELRDVAVGVVEELLPFADRKRIDLGLGTVEPCEVVGDRDSLSMLLRNLVDNALRYTPDDGRVDVSIRREPPRGSGHVVLEVTDSGPGIAEHERARVFDRFYRIPGTESSGSGIGLALVRTIAERHSGRVELEAGTGGHGLAVRVILPLAT
jgi:two-component system OmpR family sensor kinase